MSTPFAIVNVPAHEQVADLFRRQIRQGDLPLGSQLPTLNELADQLNVSASTIYRAFQRLSDEGLLVAHRARGTFVADSLPGLRRIGIYYRTHVLMAPDGHFMRAVHRCLAGRCADRNIGITSFADSRDDVSTLMPDLRQAIERQRLDGIVVLGLDPQVTSVFEGLDFPVALNGFGNLPTAVRFDMDLFAQLAVRAFRERGCRSFAIVTPLAASVHDTSQTGPHPNLQALRHLRRHAAAAGLELREEWIKQPPDEPAGLNLGSHEEYGYRQARDLLRQPELPDGLLAFFDITARGVITAVLENQACGDLSLVLHRHAEVPLICPLPAQFIVSRTADIAEGLLTSLERQHAHQPLDGPLEAPFQLDPDDA